MKSRLRLSLATLVGRDPKEPAVFDNFSCVRLIVSRGGV